LGADYLFLDIPVYLFTEIPTLHETQIKLYQILDSGLSYEIMGTIGKEDNHASRNGMYE
jgi:hypothetical protein